jgi:hypothetical protein
MLDGLGWVATALFAASYFGKTPRTMRRLQASAALLWVAYGIWMNALPIIVANLIVAALAIYSDWKQPFGVRRPVGALAGGGLAPPPRQASNSPESAPGGNRPKR